MHKTVVLYEKSIPTNGLPRYLASLRCIMSQYLSYTGIAHLYGHTHAVARTNIRSLNGSTGWLSLAAILCCYHVMLPRRRRPAMVDCMDESKPSKTRFPVPCCVSNAIHGIGQILKSLECMSVCVSVCLHKPFVHDSDHQIFVRSSSNLVHRSHMWKRRLSSVDKFQGSMAPF